MVVNKFLSALPLMSLDTPADAGTRDERVGLHNHLIMYDTGLVNFYLEMT